MKFKVLFAVLVILMPLFAANGKNKVKSTVNGKKLRIAVIDTGFTKSIESKVTICGQKDFTGLGIQDTNGHGTHITNLIDISSFSDRSKYCFIIIKAYDIKNNKHYYPEALEYLLEIKPDIINISGGGYGKIKKEGFLIKRLLDKRIGIVVASGNGGLNLNDACNYFPACYDKRIIVVGSIAKTSNYGDVVDIIKNGQNVKVLGRTLSGSSQSTAIFTGTLIRHLLGKVNGSN